MADLVRKVSIVEGRASCEVSEFSDGAVIAKATFGDAEGPPNGYVSLHVSAPDRRSARQWSESMLRMLEALTAEAINV